VAGVDEALSIAVGKDLKVGDGIGDVLKGRIDGMVGAELFPDGPMGGSGGGS
jgi:hypothetical protein